MLKKKSCENCNEKVKDSFSFCPNCGMQLKSQVIEWGMLGKGDVLPIQNIQKQGFVSGIGDKVMDKMINSAFKMMQKEFSKSMGPGRNKMPPAKMKLMINGKEINPQMREMPKKSKGTKFLPINFSEEKIEIWKDLKKEEPKSKLKRVDDKIQYEIEIPEVNSIKDISIIKLENSLEIKAIGKKLGYQKIIPIDMPLKKYTLSKGMLTLELDAAQ